MKLNLGLYEMFNNISKKISLLLFKQRLPISYIIFNALFKKFIVNKSISNDDILRFHKSGFVKLKNIDLKDEIEEYKNKFFIKEEDKKDLTKRIKFSLDDKDKKDFAIKIKKKLSPLIDNLKSYFSCDVFISDILPFRIYHIEDENNLEKESYANHFHQDGYLMIYNKIFINLMDIEEQDGPLQIIPIENKSAFFKSFKYKDRNNYNVFGNQDLIYKNTGKIGECCLFSSPQVFHKAGIPKNFRDLIQIIIVTIPKKYSNGVYVEDDIELFKGNENNIMKISKPYKLKNLLKLFLIFLKEKLA